MCASHVVTRLSVLPLKDGREIVSQLNFGVARSREGDLGLIFIAAASFTVGTVSIAS